MNDKGYEYEYDPYYCYSSTNVLKNKLNIRNPESFFHAEREISALKVASALKNEIGGDFDVNHLKRIHLFLFEDIFEWAGKFRKVNISKGVPFANYDLIEKYLGEKLDELKDENYLKTCTNKTDLARRLAYYLGEINAVHPFREGNGRTQRIFIEYLSRHNGYEIDFTKIDKDSMIDASIKSFYGDNIPLENLIMNSLIEL